MIICFNGVDGSGKSFQAQRLVQRLNAEGYPAVYIWGGGESPFTRPLTRIAQRVLKDPTKKARTAPAVPNSSDSQYRTYLNSTQRLFRNRLIRAAWRHISLAEHTIELWKTLLPHMLSNRIIVCDRYLYDSVISVAVLAGTDASSLRRLLRVPAVYRVPRPSAWFLMDVEPIVAFERKEDIPDLLYLERRVPLYREAAKLIGMNVIDGAGPPDAISEKIWHLVLPLLERRTDQAYRQGDV
jgi:thymidylate kinase